MQDVHRSSSSFALALVLGALCATSTTAQSQAAAPNRHPAFPAALQGQEAIASLGTTAAEIASLNGIPLVEMTDLLLNDESVWMGSNGRIFFVDPPAPLEADTGDEDPPRLPLVGGPLVEDEVFSLHSRPGCTKTIFLDFDGHHSRNNAWGHNIVFPPFNTQGGSGTFTDGELNSIVAQWKRVAEDFSTFEVDVTTEAPPIKGLKKNGADDQTWGLRVLMTQQTNGFGNGSGGIALLNSFNDSKDNPCFVFNKGSNNGSMTASHEAGHALGLSHDGLNGSSYHPGTGNGATGWGPIMGAPFGKTLVHWSRGDYAGSTTNQNDFNIIASGSNGITIKVDDYFDDVPALSEPLAFGCPLVNQSSVFGVIARRADKDTFRFVTVGGLVEVKAVPGKPGPNIDLLLELFDNTGLMVATENQLNQTSATITQDLPPGEYTIRIDGIDRPGRYSDYGSRGNYKVTVTLPISDAFADLGFGLVGAGEEAPLLAGSGFACAGNILELSLSGAPSGAQVFLAYGWDRIDAPYLGGTLVPDVMTGNGGMREFRADPGGNLVIPVSWANNIPIGTRVAYQYWIVDPEGPEGFSSSNAVEVEVTLPSGNVATSSNSVAEIALR